MAPTYRCPSSLLEDAAISSVGVVLTPLHLSPVPMITLYQFTIITIAIIFVNYVILIVKVSKSDLFLFHHNHCQYCHAAMLFCAGLLLDFFGHYSFSELYIIFKSSTP